MNELEKKSTVPMVRSIDEIDYDITKEHVLKAITEIDSKSTFAFARTKWKVEINGNYYPAKTVMQYAKIQSGSKLRWRRRDGPDTNQFLERMGFKIIENNNPDKQPKSTISQKPMIPTSMTTNQPYNQILFGPPGTGKTFNTVNKALEIVGEQIEGKTRREIKELFDAKIKDGQIVFTTFHQSMSYEDFIEGIKPLKPGKEKRVGYEVQSGIFKNIARDALLRLLPKDQQLNNSESISFENIYQEYLEKLKPSSGKDESIFKTIGGYELNFVEIKGSSIIVIFKWQDTAKTNPGTHSFSVTKEKIRMLFDAGLDPTKITSLKKSFEPFFHHNLSVYYAVYADFYAFAQSKTGGKPLDELENIDEIGYQELMETWYILPQEKKDEMVKSAERFVLIIDEINRGNIAQIFGELITLIEDDKRMGRKEALEVTLPYSKEKFGVPPNLYIIGTMNTADRSVEALDTALRRRFYFEEMPPKPELLDPALLLNTLWYKFEDLDWDDPKWIIIENDFLDLHNAKILNRKKFENLENEMDDDISIRTFREIVSFGEFSLQIILEALNVRIEKLLDKDHQIGHSYFMSVYSLNDLKSAIQHKIIPLLQEYFFGDFGKIGLVLGKGFFQEMEKSTDNIFAAFDDYDASEFAERTIFKLKNVMDMADNEFRDAISILLKK